MTRAAPRASFAKARNFAAELAPRLDPGHPTNGLPPKLRVAKKRAIDDLLSKNQIGDSLIVPGDADESAIQLCESGATNTISSSRNGSILTSVRPAGPSIRPSPIRFSRSAEITPAVFAVTIDNSTRGFSARNSPASRGNKYRPTVFDAPSDTLPRISPCKAPIASSTSAHISEIRTA